MTEPKPEWKTSYPECNEEVRRAISAFLEAYRLAASMNLPATDCTLVAQLAFTAQHQIDNAALGLMLAASSKVA